MQQPRAHPLLASHANEPIGGGPQALDSGQPGVGALRPLARAQQPIDRAGVARLLKMEGDGVRIRVGGGHQRLLVRAHCAGAEPGCAASHRVEVELPQPPVR